MSRGEGSETREDFRRFVVSTIRPLVMRIEAELREKLGAPDLAINAKPLRESDSQGVGRGLASLIKAGVDLDEAMELMGLE